MPKSHRAPLRLGAYGMLAGVSDCGSHWRHFRPPCVGALRCAQDTSRGLGAATRQAFAGLRSSATSGGARPPLRPVLPVRALQCSAGRARCLRCGAAEFRAALWWVWWECRVSPAHPCRTVRTCLCPVHDMKNGFDTSRGVRRLEPPNPPHQTHYGHGAPSPASGRAVSSRQRVMPLVNPARMRRKPWTMRP